MCGFMIIKTERGLVNSYLSQMLEKHASCFTETLKISGKIVLTVRFELLELKVDVYVETCSLRNWTCFKVLNY